MEMIHIVPTKYGVPKSKYHMILAHLILADGQYKKQFLEAEGYKILDNSVVEIAKPTAIDKMCDIAEEIKADEIILPDILGDAAGTKELIGKSLNYIMNRYKGRDNIPFKIMGVAQGKSSVDWFTSYVDLKLNPLIDTIGFPKVLNKIDNSSKDSPSYMSRLNFVKWVRDNIEFTKPVHLLGMNEGFEALKAYKKYDFVRSIDSCITYLFSRDNLDIKDKANTRPAKTIDFSDEMDGDISDRLYNNMNYINHILLK